MADHDNNNYLVVRYREDDVTLVFDYGEYIWDAFRMYGILEGKGRDCVLLGSDSIDTLKITHSNWFLSRVKVDDMAAVIKASRALHKALTTLRVQSE